MKRNLDLQCELQKKKAIESAKDVLKIVSNKVCKDMPQYMMFVPLLKPVAVEEDIILETDGRHLFFNADHIILMFKMRKLHVLENTFMHILTHGVLNHFELRKQDLNNDFSSVKEDELKDLVMDFRVNYFLSVIYQNNLDEVEIENNFFRYMYSLTKNERTIFDQMIKMNINELYYFCSKEIRWYEILKKVVVPYDNHEYWDKYKELTLSQENEESSGFVEEKDSGKSWSEIRKITGLNGEESFFETIKKESNTYGNTSGNLCIDYKVLKKNPKSYRNILEDLLVEKEVISKREDYIDRMLYSYGFSLYEDVALIEPEELTEEKTLPTIAVAIDTSGSCNGALMEKFLKETMGLLQDISKYELIDSVYIFQCDSVIQDEKRVRDVFDIEKMMDTETIKMRGFGGTSFVPVVDRLNEISKDKTIGALIYLTDGYGKFPEKKPDYQVVFVTPKHSNDKLPSYIRRVNI